MVDIALSPHCECLQQPGSPSSNQRRKWATFSSHSLMSDNRTTNGGSVDKVLPEWRNLTSDSLRGRLGWMAWYGLNLWRRMIDKWTLAGRTLYDTGRRDGNLLCGTFWLMICSVQVADNCLSTFSRKDRRTVLSSIADMVPPPYVTKMTYFRSSLQATRCLYALEYKEIHTQICIE